jgi:hypothetical protein
VSDHTPSGGWAGRGCPCPPIRSPAVFLADICTVCIILCLLTVFWRAARRRCRPCHRCGSICCVATAWLWVSLRAAWQSGKEDPEEAAARATTAPLAASRSSLRSSSSLSRGGWHYLLLFTSGVVSLSAGSLTSCLHRGCLLVCLLACLRTTCCFCVMCWRSTLRAVWSCRLFPSRSRLCCHGLGSQAVRPAQPSSSTVSKRTVPLRQRRCRGARCASATNPALGPRQHTVYVHTRVIKAISLPLASAHTRKCTTTQTHTDTDARKEIQSAKVVVCAFPSTPLFSNLVWCSMCALWSVRWPPNPPRTTSRNRRPYSLFVFVGWFCWCKRQCCRSRVHE